MKKLLFIILIINFCYAQTDTKFWFVAPEVTSGHGDRPIYLRISATEDTKVTISQPANPSFNPIVLNLLENTTQTVDLTPYIDIIENKPADQVLNYGFYIESEGNITAYYEVGRTNNPDIFALKGRNALGTYFFIPSQNYWNNNGSLNPIARNVFDIVATEDNTEIEITPSNDIIGHSKGETFKIILNKGQTYSCKAVSPDADKHLGGSIVKSNKPIAITISDDSVLNGYCYDLMGDQLIPVDVIGTEYIVMKGFIDGERYFITATEDDTEVRINGAYVVTLSRGQVYNRLINKSFEYIQTSKPVYVLHVTGFGCELGMAVLPTLICTGSQKVYFTRSTSEFCGIILMVRAGHQDKFLLNNDPSIITPDLFLPVDGTNGEWMVAKKQINVPVGEASVIENTGDVFHMGLVNGGSISGCRYGYFSNFRSIDIFIDEPCALDSMVLITKTNLVGETKYVWNTGDTTQSIIVKESGLYTCTATLSNCLSIDSIFVTIRNIGIKAQPERDSICPGDTIQIEALGNIKKYEWNTAENEKSIKVAPVQSTLYSVTGTDDKGCVFTDSVLVFVDTAKVKVKQSEVSACYLSDLILEAEGVKEYLWNDSVSGQQWQITVLKEAKYYVEGTNETGCKSYDSVEVKVLPKPKLVAKANPDTICLGHQSTIEVAGAQKYVWNNEVEDSKQTVEPDVTTVYSVTGTNEFNCTSMTDVMVVVIQPFKVNLIAADTTLCIGEKTTIRAELDNQKYQYQWSSGEKDSIIQVNPSETKIYTITVTDKNNCKSIDSIKINVYPLPDVSFTSDLKEGCEPLEVTFYYNSKDTNITKYYWVIANTTDSLQGDSLVFTFEKAGSYDVKLKLINSYGCVNEKIINKYITVHKTPIADFTFSPEIGKVYEPTIEFTSSSDAIEWLWNFGDSITKTVNVSSIKHTYPAEEKEYEVTLIVKNEHNCVDTIKKVVKIIDDRVTFPNIITPNNDGQNDVLKITNAEKIPNNKLVVFNRWGKVVYEVDNYKNDWDGGNLSDGTYYYIFYYHDKKHISSLTIIRK